MAGAYGAYVFGGGMMNPNYNETVTVYNRLRAADNPEGKKSVWQKTVLRNCFYKNVIGNTVTDRGLQMSNAYTVRIPQSEYYLPYAEWSKLPEREREGYFTCSMDDIVVKGECPDRIESVPPNTAAEVLSRNKPEAFAVTAFSDNTSHKCGRHYRMGG